MARMRAFRWLLGALGLLAVLLVAAGIVAWWASSHPAALEWLAAEVQRRTGGVLALEGLTGSVRGRTYVRRLVYDDGEIRAVADDVEIEWSPLALSRKVVEIERLQARALAIAVRPSDQPASPPATLALPVEVRAAAVRIDRVDYDGTLLTDLSGRYEGGPSHHLADDVVVDSEWGRVTGQARIDARPPYALVADALVTHERGLARVLASGRLAAIALDIQSESSGATAVGTATIEPYAAKPIAGVALHVEDLDLSAFDPALPTTRIAASVDAARATSALLAGRLDAENLAPGMPAKGRVPVQSLRGDVALQGSALLLDRMRGDLGAAGVVTGRGRLGLENGELDLAFEALNLRGLHATLRATKLGGTAKFDYGPGGERMVARVSEQGIRLELDAERRGDRIDVAKFQAAFGRGTATGRAEVSLAGNQPFTATARFARLDPSAFGDYPAAALNGELRVQGRLSPDWSANVALDLATGTFRGAPLSGSAKGDVTAGMVRNGDVSLRVGDNSLRAQGDYGRSGDAITFSLDARQPSVLEPRLSGRLVATGRVEGAAPNPSFSVEADGERISWNGRALAESIRLRTAGTLPSHSIDASGTFSTIPARAEAQGGWSRTHGWSGMLTSFESGGTYPFALAAPMPVAISPSRVEAGPGQASFSGGLLDVESIRWENDRLDTRGAFAALPAVPFLAAAGFRAGPRSNLRLAGRWDVRATPALNGTVQIARESGDLLLPMEPDVALGLRRLQVSAQLVNDAVQATAEIDASVGQASARIAASGLTRDATLQADGTATLPSLRPFEALVGTSAIVEGRIDLTFAASGTVGNPNLSAALTGRDMRIDAPQYGIALRDGALRATLADGVLRLENFSARADTGRFVAEGAMPLRGAETSARLEWRAERLALFNRPDRRLTVDGSGSLAIEKGRLALRGSLKADSAYFEFDRSTTAELGDDVVVKGRPREQARAPFRSALLDLDLDLDFGNNFRILGAGLETALVGRLQVRTAPDGSLVANGIVRSVQGSYYAFGQKLTIERGRLIFDGPIENPSLDVLAMRKNMQVEAGVEVSGTVKVPRIRLVSNPPVPDTEKLTWLTLGSGPETLSGANLALVQAAAAAVMSGGGSKLPLGRRVAQQVGLDDISVRGSGAAGSQVVAFGKRLSDRVYIEYEQGLLATNFVLRLSYALSRVFSVSAETGRATGAGIYYRRSFD